MKISAPIIAIMAASTSVVASAKQHRLDSFSRKGKDDDSDPACAILRVVLAQQFATDAFCILNKFTDLKATYNGADEEDELQPEKVVLEGALILIFENFFAIPFMLQESDGYADGIMDGKIDYAEMTGHFLKSLEDHSCTEVDGLAMRIRGGALNLGSGMIDFAGSGVVDGDLVPGYGHGDH